jgi:rhodanese-related sulfurtransferase
MTMRTFVFSRIALPILVLASTLSTGCENAQTSKNDGPVLKDVSNVEFQELITNLEGALLLDVRTPDEWKEGHLEGAAHADYWGDEKAFEDAMNAIPRHRPVLVYCAGGGRSGLTAKELVAAGHQEVYNLENGISGWERDGLPVVTGPPSDF